MYIIIVGCGRSGSMLANMLSEEGHDVVVIDKDKGSFKGLGSLFNGLTYQGKGSDLELLEEAGIRRADGIALMTNSDTSNATVAQIAKKIYKTKWVVAKIYDPELRDSLKDFGFDIICPTILISRLFQNRFLKGFLRSYYQNIEDRLELVEIPAHEHIVGKKYGSLNVPGIFSVISCKNESSCIIPTAEMVVRKEDILFCILNRAKKETIMHLLGPISMIREKLKVKGKR